MNEIKARIEKLKDEIRQTPYHKGTEHHIGKLRARIAQLEDQLLARPKGGGGRGSFAIKKAGDATAVLLGLPSVGKSKLLNKLTAASSKVASYPFTTTTVIPGMMNYQGAQIQILDLPGIIEDASSGRGHGREILSAARAADLLLIMTDVKRINQLPLIINELTKAGLRINQDPPKVVIKKKDSGSLTVRLPGGSCLVDAMTVANVASEFHLVNAEIIIKEDLTIERLIDAFSPNRVYIKAIFVVNKIDLTSDSRDLKTVIKKMFTPINFISADKEMGLDSLKSAIWDNLQLIRVYLKKPDGETDFNNPLIVKKGTTVYELGRKISNNIVEKLEGAKIWGPGSAYPGQKVGVNFLIHDEQVITLCF